MLFKSELFKSRPYKLGLTLSGGGAKCMAQVGMLQYLEEQGVRPDVISGASGGAMIGALYGAGHSPEKILSFFTDNRMFSMKSLSFSALGLIDSGRMAKNFKGWFAEDSFESLTIPLHVVATDLNKASQEVFSEGPLVQALLASSAYPGMFTPVEMQGTVFADGGIINNYPTDLINEQCQFHLGMYLDPVTHKPGDHFANAFDVLDRVFQIYSSARLLANIDLADISLTPEGIEKWGPFMVKNDQLQTLFGMGYETSQAYFENEGAGWLQKVKDNCNKKSLMDHISGKL